MHPGLTVAQCHSDPGGVTAISPGFAAHPGSMVAQCHSDPGGVNTAVRFQPVRDHRFANLGVRDAATPPGSRGHDILYLLCFSRPYSDFSALFLGCRPWWEPATYLSRSAVMPAIAPAWDSPWPRCLVLVAGRGGDSNVLITLRRGVRKSSRSGTVSRPLPRPSPAAMGQQRTHHAPP